MPRDDLLKGRVSLSQQIYFITSVTQQRTPYFADFHCARLVIKEMKRLHEEDYVQSLAFVIMPDHIHWLLTLQDKDTLSNTIKLLKGRSAQRIKQYLHLPTPVWQKAFYDHALRKEEDLVQIARYIVANPLRAQLVTRVADYPLWDAIWL
ncbi:MAG: transposase [Methylococcaceae bacterium]